MRAIPFCLASEKGHFGRHRHTLFPPQITKYITPPPAATTTKMPNLHFPRRLAFPRNPSFMLLLCSLAACLVAMIMTRPVASFQRPLAASRRFGWRMSASESDAAAPTTFREAEVLGLKLMQEGDYDLALKGTCGSFDNTLVGWYQRPFDSTHSFRSFHHLYTAFQTGLKLPGSRSDVVRSRCPSLRSSIGKSD